MIDGCGENGCVYLVYVLESRGVFVLGGETVVDGEDAGGGETIGPFTGVHLVAVGGHRYESTSMDVNDYVGNVFLDLFSYYLLVVLEGDGLGLEVRMSLVLHRNRMGMSDGLVGLVENPLVDRYRHWLNLMEGYTIGESAFMGCISRRLHESIIILGDSFDLKSSAYLAAFLVFRK